MVEVASSGIIGKRGDSSANNISFYKRTSLYRYTSFLEKTRLHFKSNIEH